ncbi:hypothetical protein LAZ67_20002517 [Cordylochernes scorpioides]|uniref:Uncharacterized protein n=1 Tax=Cordylochernes scorpioides TaxID=51811 RepID=A0ABY6LPM6_9ARAC|nr:hypothetical protein LAZ67_20002517 [Cordylochernes scorpioides]
MQPKLVGKHFYFIQDIARAHYSNIVRTFLNEMFPHKWMRRRGLIDWPVQSPDLTLTVFFLWAREASQPLESPPPDKVFLNTLQFHTEELLIDALLGRHQDGQGVMIQAISEDSALQLHWKTFSAKFHQLDDDANHILELTKFSKFFLSLEVGETMKTPACLEEDPSSPRNPS